MNITRLHSQYPIQKPKPLTQLWLLALLTCGGLIALFFAAYQAFVLVANPIQAFFAALLIEAGLVIEALALIKRPKSIFPWLGLLISFAVSGTYNFTQAATAANDRLAWLELLALSFGPLAALALVSLTLGAELKEHQNSLSEWRRKRAEWVESERKRLERKAVRAEKRAEAVFHFPEPSGNLPVTPKWLPIVPQDLRHFKSLVEAGEVILPPGLTGVDLKAHIPSVGTDRTGRNWLEAVGYRNNGRYQ